MCVCMCIYIYIYIYIWYVYIHTYIYMYTIIYKLFNHIKERRRNKKLRIQLSGIFAKMRFFFFQIKEFVNIADNYLLLFKDY